MRDQVHVTTPRGKPSVKQLFNPHDKRFKVLWSSGDGDGMGMDQTSLTASWIMEPYADDWCAQVHSHGIERAFFVDILMETIRGADMDYEQEKWY